MLKKILSTVCCIAAVTSVIDSANASARPDSRLSKSYGGEAPTAPKKVVTPEQKQQVLNAMVLKIPEYQAEITKLERSNDDPDNLKKLRKKLHLAIQSRDRLQTIESRQEPRPTKSVSKVLESAPAPITKATTPVEFPKPVPTKSGPENVDYSFFTLEQLITEKGPIVRRSQEVRNELKKLTEGSPDYQGSLDYKRKVSEIDDLLKRLKLLNQEIIKRKDRSTTDPKPKLTPAPIKKTPITKAAPVSKVLEFPKPAPTPVEFPKPVSQILKLPTPQTKPVQTPMLKTPKHTQSSDQQEAWEEAVEFVRLQKQLSDSEKTSDSMQNIDDLKHQIEQTEASLGQFFKSFKDSITVPQTISSVEDLDAYSYLVSKRLSTSDIIDVNDVDENVVIRLMTDVQNFVKKIATKETVELLRDEFSENLKKDREYNSIAGGMIEQEKLIASAYVFKRMRDLLLDTPLKYIENISNYVSANIKRDPNVGELVCNIFGKAIKPYFELIKKLDGEKGLIYPDSLVSNSVQYFFEKLLTAFSMALGSNLYNRLVYLPYIEKDNDFGTGKLLESRRQGIVEEFKSAVEGMIKEITLSSDVPPPAEDK